jgi:hypothetical protein
MKKENPMSECCKDKIFSHGHECHCKGHGNCSSGAIYGLGVIGALFYFLGKAATFGAVMLGIGKAFFWPAILMFKLLTYLGM